MNRILIILGLIISFQVSVFALEKDSRKEADHQLHAVSYEEHIRKLEGTIEIHEQMKKDYQETLKGNNDIPQERIRKMIKHCEEIIEESKELRDDLAKFTKKHKKMEKEKRR